MTHTTHHQRSLKAELIQAYREAGMVYQATHDGKAVYTSPKGRVAIMPSRVNDRRDYRRVLKEAGLS